VAWTQEEQDELRQLYEKAQEGGEGDLIDRIMLEISDGGRKRREICNQLVNIGCAQSIDEFKEAAGGKKLGRNRLWRPEDLVDLRQCFALVQEDARQTGRELRLVMPQLQECLSVKRSKQVIADKLLEMGLIKERAEVLGGRAGRKEGAQGEVESGAEESGEKVVRRKKAKKAKKKSRDAKEASDLFDAESGL